MIELINVTKIYPIRHGRRTVLNGIDLHVAKGQKIGIFGRNGSGKSTLIRMISGAELPTSGRIHRGISVSWPLAFGGAFQQYLTGFDNLRFICRTYDIDFKGILKFVEDFTELGIYLREPVLHYSSGMRARLAFALSMAIEFDCFLIDEIIAVGDSRFHDKCMYELFEKRKDRALIVVSHDSAMIKNHCEIAYVLTGGKLTSHDSVDAAFDFYQTCLQ
jgi:capsular polysaccharide transport system ATP-binding protein